MVHRAWFLLAGGLLALSAASAGCSTDAARPPEQEDFGRVLLALMQVPDDVHCLRVTAVGDRTVSRAFAVNPGTDALLAMNALPIGLVDFAGEAFVQTCRDLASATPGWISDPVQVVLTGQAVANVTLVMRRNGRASIGVDFRSEPICRSEQQPCSGYYGYGDQCCTGLTCVPVDGGGRHVCRSLEAPRPLLFALLLSNLEPFGLDPVASAIEAVDLAAGSIFHFLDTGPHHVSSIAVSPDGSRVYLAQLMDDRIVAVSVPSGATLYTVPVTFPRDLVLSADGATLFSTAATSLVAIDTSTGVVTSELSTGDDSPLSLSLSPDGSKLGAPTTQGGASAAYYLVTATSPLTLVSRIVLAQPFPDCATFPNDSVFTDTGRALLWDANCDAIYQIDTDATAQLGNATIVTSRDDGVFLNSNNVLSYSPISRRAYAVKESSELVIADPAAATASLLGGFGGTPFVVTQTPDGRAQYIAVGESAQYSLARIDSATGTVQHGVYTFSAPDKVVRDMQIVVVQP
jgi:DNA-binding beta-propeller fold protein YncE